MLHLFLSPHLDDGVLSCGATIRRLTTNNQRARILTVTCGDPPDPLPDSPVVKDLHGRWQGGHNPVAMRRAEDSAACRVVGADALHLPLLDCIYRVDAQGQAPYATWDDVFGDVQEGDPLPSELDVISDKLPDSSEVTLYVPLGAGHHVDHQIVRDWGIRLATRKPSWTLRFYEEYPYIEKDEHAAERALDYLMLNYPELQLEMQVFWVSESEVQAKCDAIACYGSQISSFWENEAAMRHSVRATMQRVGVTVLAERFYGRM
jgi:LmbE family N-acetylglucosaminyl deacetylase